MAVASLSATAAIALGSPAQSVPQSTAPAAAYTQVAAASATTEIRLRSAVGALRVAVETRAGYNRANFTHWTDDDRDCQDTRAEVLRQESQTGVSGPCTVRTGKWKSYYDGKTWTKASDVDIDHLVALAEAWDSGARNWSASIRRQFANDLADKRSLVAVTDNVNSSKGDRDPAQWMPAQGRCRYVGEWVAVKLRWNLSVDKAERNALAKQASDCKNVVLKVAKRVTSTPSSPQPTPVPTPTPMPTPMPTATPTPTPEPTPECSWDGVCSTPTPTPTPPAAPPTPTPIPIGNDPRYSTCTAAKSAGYGPYYRSRDPEYYWYDDRDNDGIVCE